MSRTLFVEGKKTFTLVIPDDAKVTFGPWSPPSNKEDWSRGESRGGTLRIYKGSKTTGDVLGVFSGVTGFRDTTQLGYDDFGAGAADGIPQPELTRVPLPVVPFMDEAEKEELAERVAKILTTKALADKDEF